MFHFALASQLLLSEKEKGNLKECHIVIWLQGTAFREMGVNCESKVKAKVKVKTNKPPNLNNETWNTCSKLSTDNFSGR